MGKEKEEEAEAGCKQEIETAQKRLHPVPMLNAHAQLWIEASLHGT